MANKATPVEIFGGGSSSTGEPRTTTPVEVFGGGSSSVPPPSGSGNTTPIALGSEEYAKYQGLSPREQFEYMKARGVVPGDAEFVGLGSGKWSYQAAGTYRAIRESENL